MISVKFGSDMCVVAIFPTHIIFIADLYESVCVCVREHAKRTTVNIHISNFEWHEINVFHLIVTVISTHRETVSRSLSQSISFALSPVI